MSVAWIKIEHITPDKPEIVSMADALKIDQDAVFGKVIRIWIWADQQTISGDDLIVTPSFLDRLTNCSGFSQALLKVGWLKSRNGRFSLPHFDRHNGQTAKNRALSADRMQRQRYAQSVTETAPELELEKERKKKNKRIENELNQVGPEHRLPAPKDPPSIPQTRAAIKKFADSGEPEIILRFWKEKVSKDTPTDQTLKNIASRLKDNDHYDLIYSIQKYRQTLPDESEGKEIFPYKGSNFFGKAAYYKDYLPTPEEKESAKIKIDTLFAEAK